MVTGTLNLGGFTAQTGAKVTGSWSPEVVSFGGSVAQVAGESLTFVFFCLVQ